MQGPNVNRFDPSVQNSPQSTIAEVHLTSISDFLTFIEQVVWDMSFCKAVASLIRGSSYSGSDASELRSSSPSYRKLKYAAR